MDFIRIHSLRPDRIVRVLGITADSFYRITSF